jgi:hypothetical protein
MYRALKLLSILGIAIAMVACEEIPEILPDNIPAAASGTYRGTLTNSFGITVENAEIELSESENGLIQVVQIGVAESSIGTIEWELEKTGAAIHQPFGSESFGTFLLDLGAEPDELTFEMSDGSSFDGYRFYRPE